MKLKGKNIDALHQVLFVALVLMIVGYVLRMGDKFSSSKSIELLQATTEADFALMNGDFDRAEIAYDQISKQYPNFDSISVRIEMVNVKREEHMAFVSLQDEMNNNVETIENLESYMVIIENRNKNLRKNQESIKSTSSEVTTEDSSYEATDTDSPDRESNSLVKDILDIVNFDGVDIKYIGETLDGKANGYGYAVFSKKGFYEGYWSNNTRNGNGIYYWQSGDTYEGAYVNGKREGFGMYTFASGEIYVGYWKNNLRDGEGELKNKKGKLVFKGEWEEDEPVPSSKKKR